MAFITETPVWRPDIYQIGTTDPVLGGPDGIANAAAKSLADRTSYLYQQLQQMGGVGAAVLFNTGDLNNVQTPGFYQIGTAVTNIPLENPDRGHMLVSGGPTGPTGGSSTPAVLQMYFARTGEIYSRQLSSLAWGAWNEFLTTTSMARLNPMPPGSVIYFAGDATPVGFIKAQGQLLSRAVYPELFAAIGELYGAGDGSNTFALPDLRGEFIRGVDASRGVDTGRALGSTQSDDIKAHTHNVNQYIADSPPILVNTTLGAAKAVATEFETNPTASNGGSETRPRNVAMHGIIRY